MHFTFATCKFATLHDDMLRDRLVLGACDKACRARLFREKECNLAKAIESFRINEATLEQLTVIGSKEEETVNAVNEKSRQQPSRITERTMRKKISVSSKPQAQSCRCCGGKRHKERQQCPAYGKCCRLCGKQNHFQSVCRRQSSKQVHVVRAEESED